MLLGDANKRRKKEIEVEIKGLRADLWKREKKGGELARKGGGRCGREARRVEVVACSPSRSADFLRKKAKTLDEQTRKVRHRH
jgi:hypothetical protein